MPISSVSFRAFGRTVDIKRRSIRTSASPLECSTTTSGIPDLERFVDRFFEYEPEVGVIGDVDEIDDVDAHVAAAREIKRSYPEAELIVVPKSRAVIDAIPETLVLGYSRGYADRLAHTSSPTLPIGGRRVHILGGSPPKQLDAIRQLTRPTLTDEPPADIVGVGWNGLHRGAVRRVLDGRRLGRQRSRRRPRHRAKDGAPQPRSRP